MISESQKSMPINIVVTPELPLTTQSQQVSNAAMKLSWIINGREKIKKH
jgi:hypothetical protein